MDNRLLSIAVIGYGYWSPKLIRNLRENSSYALKMICEKDLSRHAQVSKENPDIEVIQNYRDVFARNDIDAVVIATIPSSHFRIAKQALDSGKHVLIEKPLTLRPIEAQLLKYIADKKKLTLMVDHTYLYTPAIQMLKKRIASGELGHIYSFESKRVNLGLFQRDTNVVWDLAPHDFAILSYLFDERPAYISVVGSKTVVHPMQEKAQESEAYIMLFYKYFVAHINVSWISPIKVRQITVIGSERTALYDQLSPQPLTIFDQGVYPNSDNAESGPLFGYKIGSAEAVELPNDGEDIARMLADFLNAVCAKSIPTSNVNLGLAVVQMLYVAERSLKRGGKRIPISYTATNVLFLQLYSAYIRFRHGY